MLVIFTKPARQWWMLALIALVVAGAWWFVRPAHPRPFRLGLDLKGGSHLVYRGDVSAVPDRDQRGAMEGVRDVIERRVNALGVAEPVVQLTESRGEWRLIVELAGVYDTARAVEAIGATPVLEFRELRSTAPDLTADQQAELDRRNREAKRKAQEEILPQALARDGDFATLARVHSQDPGSAVQGGDLGWFKRDVMVKEFERAVFDDLTEGAVTKQLVETEFGWHIIKKTGAREVEDGEGVKAVETGIIATTESGAPVAVSADPNLTTDASRLTPRHEVRASHILIRKVTAADLLGRDARWAGVGLGGKQLKRAYLSFDPNSNEPNVTLEFNDEGAALLAEVSKRNVGNPLGIFIDGLSPVDMDGDGAITDADEYAPTIREELTGGSAVISGNMTVPQAKELANRLQAGALPVPVALLTQTTVGPTLGKTSVAASIRAAWIGVLLIALFMVVYYRLPGVVSVVALGAYGILVLAVLKLIGATLTLAGLAGFVMSLGMAVDANVLIFERLREELRNGRSLLDALDEGFRRAWTSIRDSNVTTLLTCLILASFSTSVVKGFAVTLGVGVLVSMFSALTVTRIVLRCVAGFAQRPWLYGVRQPSRE